MKVILFHIPKTAGSALVKSLHQAYFNFRHPLTRFHFGVCPRATMRATAEETICDRIAVAKYAMNLEGVSLVTGHIPYFEYEKYVKDPDDWASIAVLRNPVDRWLSQYFYNLGKESDHFKTDADLDEYLQTDLAVKSGQVYCRMFSGENNDPEIAIANISKLSFLGLQEDLESFVTKLGNRLGKRLKLKHVNKRPKSQRGKRATVTENQLSRIHELCSLDIEVYEHFVRAKSVTI